MDWIHCNNCYFQPGQLPKRDFLLTSCGHIFCQCCEGPGPIEKCKVCGIKCSTIHLTSQLDKEVQMYFLEMVQEAKKTLQIMDFQGSHRMRLNAYYRKVVEKYHMLKLHTQKLSEENQALKRDLEIFKSELENCKRNIDRKATLNTSVNQLPLFCMNSQITKAIQRGSTPSTPSTPTSSTSSSPFFVTPSRMAFTSQQYRNGSTPRTPASETSSDSPASVLSGHSYSSQNSVKSTNFQRSYTPGLTPPMHRLSLLTANPPRICNTRY